MAIPIYKVLPYFVIIAAQKRKTRIAILGVPYKWHQECISSGPLVSAWYPLFTYALDLNSNWKTRVLFTSRVEADVTRNSVRTVYVQHRWWSVEGGMEGGSEEGRDGEWERRREGHFLNRRARSPNDVTRGEPLPNREFGQRALCAARTGSVTAERVRTFACQTDSLHNDLTLEQAPNAYVPTICFVPHSNRLSHRLFEHCTTQIIVQTVGLPSERTRSAVTRRGLFERRTAQILVRFDKLGWFERRTVGL